jgi:hypothetical protein
VADQWGPLNFQGRGINADHIRSILRTYGVSAQQIVTGRIQLGQEIASANYVAGSAGWMIDGDGNAEFNNVTVRGTIYATAGEITGTLTIASTGTLDIGTGWGRIRARVSAGTGYIEAGEWTYTAGSDFVNPAVRIQADLISWRTGPNITASPKFAYLFGGVDWDSDSGGVPANNYSWTGLFIEGVPVYEFEFGSFTRGGMKWSDISGIHKAAFFWSEWYDKAWIAATNLVVESTGTLEFWTAGSTRFRIGTTALVGADDSAGGPWIRSAVGSASTPTYSFYGDSDTGIYWRSTNSFGLVTNGTLRWWLDANGALWGNTHPIVGVQYIRSGDGSKGAPSYQFTNDTNTGIYLVSSDLLGFAAGGFQTAVFGVNGLTLGAEGTGNYAIEVGPTGLGASSASTFIDFHTGRNNDRDARIIASGGTTSSDGATLTINSASFRAVAAYNVTTGSAANVFIASTGEFQRSTSSRRYKDKITPAWNLADIDLTPVRFWSRTDERWQFGFIAEDVAEAVPEAAEHNEAGGVENYDLRAVVAVLAAKVARLEKELALR